MSFNIRNLLEIVTHELQVLFVLRFSLFFGDGVRLLLDSTFGDSYIDDELEVEAFGEVDLDALL